MKPATRRATMLKVALLSGLGPSLLYARDGPSLKRKRNLASDSTIAENSSRSAEITGDNYQPKMEDLRELAAIAAQVELDTARMLWSSNDFSMPTISPNEPIPVPTPAPNPTIDCLQGRNRADYIYDLLTPITSGSLLNDPSTPQGMAFEYLATDDPYLEDPCESEMIEQRYGLTTLYFSTAGDSWVNQAGWLGPDQECAWYGISCDQDPNIVTRVELTNNNLLGSLPNELQTLNKMASLNVFSNTVTGSIPDGISQCTDLILLDLEQNLLTGSAFPDSIFDLSSLLAYRVSDNFVSGTISQELSRLQLLEQLWLATNQLTGTLPTQLGSLSNLETVFLYENQLTGPLPAQLGDLKRLEELRLYGNTLQESIPQELAGATNLEHLRLEFNFFTGTVPAALGNLINLVDLRVDRNSLSGELPEELGQLTLLESLAVNNNFLSGLIPDMFGQLERLDFFDASNNLFVGSLPESLFSVPSLRLVYLSNNTLSGTIPSGYSQPPLLRDLFLDGNILIGTVPAIEAGQFQELNELLLHFNNLSGTMPTSVCNLRGASGNLEDLFSDCGGEDPEIQCNFPECCNRCFEGVFSQARQRRERRQLRKEQRQLRSPKNYERSTRGR